MGHLTSVQLIDLAEGTQDGSSLPHLYSCDRCRQRLVDLQATMSAAGDLDLPEPSPLFWDQLSARVGAAVEAERVTSSGSWRWSRWSRWSTLSVRPLWTGALAVAVFAIALSRLGRTPEPVATSPTAVQTPTDHFGVPDDASLSLVGDLAADLDWDGASEAGLTTHVGADDDAVIQLTDAERRELHDLLTGAMKRPGA